MGASLLPLAKSIYYEIKYTTVIHKLTVVTSEQSCTVS